MEPCLSLVWMEKKAESKATLKCVESATTTKPRLLVQYAAKGMGSWEAEMANKPSKNGKVESGLRHGINGKNRRGW